MFYYVRSLYDAIVVLLQNSSFLSTNVHEQLRIAQYSVDHVTTNFCARRPVISDSKRSLFQLTNETKGPQHIQAEIKGATYRQRHCMFQLCFL